VEERAMPSDARVLATSISTEANSTHIIFCKYCYVQLIYTVLHSILIIRDGWMVRVSYNISYH